MTCGVLGRPAGLTPRSDQHEATPTKCLRKLRTALCTRRRPPERLSPMLSRAARRCLRAGGRAACVGGFANPLAGAIEVLSMRPALRSGDVLGGLALLRLITSLH